MTIRTIAERQLANKLVLDADRCGRRALGARSSTLTRDSAGSRARSRRRDDRLGDRLSPTVVEHLQRRGITRVVVEREDWPGGEGEVLAVLTGELLGERAVVEVRLGQ